MGGLGLALFPLVCAVEIVATGAPGWVSAAVGVAGLVGVPVAVAIAMLRHDLYDVDRALASSIAWLFVSALLLALYVVASSAIGVLIGRGSAGAAAAAAALCALALAPLRRRLGALVDRRLYPLRRSAFDAIEALDRDVGAGRAQPEALQAVLRSALRDDGLVVGYRLPGGDGFVDRDGARVPDAGGSEVSIDGLPIGVLVPAAGLASPGLLREVAARATALVEVVRLRLELAGALREVEASRARLLQAGYEERRRLERDLHDGAQQRLVSLGMSIRLAQRHLEDGSVDVAGLLDDTVAQLATAVAELRLLAQGIRPSSLDDGLEAALARLVQDVPVEVESDVVAGPLPDDVATTAYFVVSEAVANAIKHADARRIGLRVSRENGRVLVRVTDDGRGGARLQPGSGIADRVAALGGSHRDQQPRGSGDDRRGGAAMRVVIGEDSALFREGLARLLEDAGFEVVAKAGDAVALVAAVEATRPDLAIVDIRMPPDRTDDGARAARELRGRHPDLAIVLLSQHLEARHSVELVAAGRFGYLLKDRVFDVDDFIDALRRVAAGGSALDPEVVATLLGPRRRNDPLALLTPREREVLGLMAEGRTNAGIADRLFLTARTVETHVASILAKLGIGDSAHEHRRVLAVLAWLGARQWLDQPSRIDAGTPSSHSRPGHGLIGSRPLAPSVRLISPRWYASWLIMRSRIDCRVCTSAGRPGSSRRTETSRVSTVQRSSTPSITRHVDAHAWTSSSTERGCVRSSSQPGVSPGNGVCSAPGSPKTSHSQKTLGPTVWAATAQIGHGSVS